VEENKQLDSPDQTSQEGTYSTPNKPAHNIPVEITMPGTDHHSKAQPESPDCNERANARTRRNKRRQQKAAEKQRAQLSDTDNNQNNTEQAKNKLLQNIIPDDNSVPQKQTGNDTSTKATSEEPSPQQCSPTLAITDQSSLEHSPRPESPEHLSPKVRGTTDDASPEQPSTTSPSTEQPIIESHRAEYEMTWAEVVGRKQEKHTQAAKEEEPVPVLIGCHMCYIMHWPCDCPAMFWNCDYCGQLGHSYYVCDTIR